MGAVPRHAHVREHLHKRRTRRVHVRRRLVLHPVRLIVRPEASVRFSSAQYERSIVTLAIAFRAVRCAAVRCFARPPKTIDSGEFRPLNRCGAYASSLATVGSSACTRRSSVVPFLPSGMRGCGSSCSPSICSSSSSMGSH
jgi:hypothetical protein